MAKRGRPRKEKKTTDFFAFLRRPNFRNNLLIVLLIVLSFFAGSLWSKVQYLEKGGQVGSQQSAVQPDQPGQPTEQTGEAPALSIKKPEKTEPWRGSKNARYVWVEYSDFECPFCKKIHPDLIKLLEEYEGKLAWVYRHFPLAFHAKAQKSAEATECAADLGGEEAFWQLTDLIFEKMPEMELADLSSLASSVGLNQSSFQQCLDSGKHEQKVKDQFDEGSKAGINSTPTSVVFDMETDQSKTVIGAQPYETLKSSLDEFIQD